MGATAALCAAVFVDETPVYTSRLDVAPPYFAFPSTDFFNSSSDSTFC